MLSVPTYCALALLSVCIATQASTQKFQGKEYFLIKENLSSFGANQACKNRGGRLVQIMSHAEDEFVYNNLVKPAKNWVSLGGKSVKGSSSWTWLDGTPVDYAHWYNEPKNEAGMESSLCMEPTTGKWWHYETGKFSAFALCEKV